MESISSKTCILRFAPFLLSVFMGWGKRQISLISPWLESVNFTRFRIPHPFPSNSTQCREFSPAQGQRSQFIPLYSPTYSPGWPGVLPQGQADDMCIRHITFQIMLGLPVEDPCSSRVSVSSQSQTNKKKTKQKHIRLVCKFHIILIVLLFTLIISFKIAEMSI